MYFVSFWKLVVVMYTTRPDCWFADSFTYVFGYVFKWSKSNINNFFINKNQWNWHKNYIWYQNQSDFVNLYCRVHSPQLPLVAMLLDYKTTKMRLRKNFLPCFVTICAKTGSSRFMLQVINSFAEGLSQ